MGGGIDGHSAHDSGKRFRRQSGLTGAGDEGEHVVVNPREPVGSGSDDGASPPMHLHEALLAEHLIRVQHGMEVHLQRCRHLARGRQPIAGTGMAGDDLPAHSVRELCEQRCRPLRVDTKKHVSIL